MTQLTQYDKLLFSSENRDLRDGIKEFLDSTYPMGCFKSVYRGEAQGWRVYLDGSGGVADTLYPTILALIKAYTKGYIDGKGFLDEWITKTEYSQIDLKLDELKDLLNDDLKTFTVSQVNNPTKG